MVDQAMDDTKLDQIASLLRELVKWSKFASSQQLRLTLDRNLQSDTEKKVFELTDGHRSVRDIEKIVNVNNRTILRWWTKWAKLGIVEESGTYKGRMIHICSLEQIGIDIPQIPLSVSSGPKKTPESVEGKDEGEEIQ